jgi:hypothetical protein
MRQRPVMKYHPGLERIEEKQLLSASPLATHAMNPSHGSRALHQHTADTSGALGATSDIAKNHADPQARNHFRNPQAGAYGYLGFRVTQRPYKLIPPFQQVLVQRIPPVPGQVYNVLSIALKNGTSQTFNSSSGFTVRIPGYAGKYPGPDKGIPILTGNEQWKPQQVLVFYVLSKIYYPLSPQVQAGFQFDLGGRSTTLVPGPSAIFLRLKYNPATFAKTLDWIMAYGQGAQLGTGPKFGIPDTAINEFVDARTQRIDFGGHF